MTPIQYTQLYPNETIMVMLKENYEINHGKEGSTISSTTVPYITIAQYGIYEIKARIAKFYTQDPQLSVGAFCGGCFFANGKTLEEMIADIKVQIEYKDELLEKNLGIFKPL